MLACRWLRLLRLLTLLDIMSKGREKRGVLMTATSRKRGSWKDLQDEEVDIADSDDECDHDRKASQLEWLALESEVKKDLRKKDFDSGIRHTALVNYDDVAGEESEDDSDGPPSAPSSPEAAPTAAPADGEAALPSAPSAKGAVDEDGERVVPQGVTTAGDQANGPKKRGGEKKTGAAKKRRREGPLEGEDGDGEKKKKKKEEDPDRWLKMRLEGEEKPKKIDATRVVHYHDFDSSATSAASRAPLEPVANEKPMATPGSFRSTLRRDLFDGSDDEDDA